MSEEIWTGARIMVLRGKHEDEYGVVKETDRYPHEARDEGLVLLDSGRQIWVAFEDMRRTYKWERKT